MNKEIKKLKIGDFIRKGVQGSFGHYFSHILPDEKEVCLEACLNGYDVAIYDKKGGNLIGEKTCTNIQGMLESQIVPGFSIMTGEALEKAWTLWSRNFYNAKRFFDTKGNIQTKAKLKAKWLKEFQEDIENIIKNEMKCDNCKRQINYCFYINDKYWLKAVGKKEGHLCAHCILEKLGGLEWYIIWSEPTEKSKKQRSGGDITQLIKS